MKRGALNQLDAVGHRVGFDGGPVVGADVDIDADDLAVWALRVERFTLFGGVAVVQQGEHGGAEDQRAAVGDAVFDDQVWA
jgi:hypothetical protein